jgi:hypothetical protein
MDALTVRGATRLGKTGEVIVNIVAKTFGKFVPAGLATLSGGSVSGCSDQPWSAAAQVFQARTIGRRVALREAIPVNSVR